MKIKHNKLRNTGLIYEMLVRQITTDTLNNKDSEAISILKKYFNNTEIAKEYRIYNAIASTKYISESKAGLLLDAIKEAYAKINKNKVKKEKYNLISEIKSRYNIEEFFKPKLDTYKVLATTYMILEYMDTDLVAPEKVAEYRFTLMEHMSAPKQEMQEDDTLNKFSSLDRGQRNLVFKMMVSDFNSKYSNLDTRQKALLKEYMNNLSSPDTFKSYLNEEIEAVKIDLKRKIRKINDEVRKVKLQEVFGMIKPVPDNRKVNSDDVHNVLSYYELLKEIENVVEA